MVICIHYDTHTEVWTAITCTRAFVGLMHTTDWLQMDINPIMTLEKLLCDWSFRWTIDYVCVRYSNRFMYRHGFTPQHSLRSRTITFFYWKPSRVYDTTLVYRSYEKTHIQPTQLHVQIFTAWPKSIGSYYLNTCVVKFLRDNQFR